MDKDDILAALLKGTTVKLPTLPVVGLRIIETCKNEDFFLDDLARLISSDPALTVKTIRLANSPMHALVNPVKSIDQAASLLGADAIKNIALSFIIISALTRDRYEGFDKDHFWKRAVTAAVAGDVLSRRVGVRSDGAFVTNLLMDVGVMVMLICRPDDYRRVLREKMTSNRDLLEVEREAFGFDHQEVGTEMLKGWGLPEEIYVPIAHHHTREDCPEEYAGHAAVLKASSLVSSLYHGGRSVERQRELAELLREEFEIDAEAVHSFIDEVAERAVGVLKTFEIAPGEMRPYSEILQEANGELSDLGVTYGELVLELRQSKEKAEKLAAELEEANKKLKRLAYKDSMTGLYNHRYFHEVLDREISRADRYSRRFSLVLFDIDRYKEINDNHGHMRGDFVLSILGDLLKRSIRKSDIPARVGGDEFAVLLPDTGGKEAFIFAEKLRKAVEAVTLDWDDRKVGFTISLGVGAYVPERKKQKTSFFEEVDDALYRSKKEGRNRTSIAAAGDD